MNVPPDFPRVFWLTVFAVIIGYEAYAVYSGKTDHTMSYTIWWLLGTGDDGREWFRTVGRVIVVGGLLWMIPHFMSGWSWFR